MKKGHWYIAATAFLFSTMEVASKMIAHQLNPFQLTFIRFLVGGLFLLPFAIVDARKRGLKLKVGDFAYLAMLGLIGIAVSMSIYQTALISSKASLVAVVFSTNTIFTALFAVLILREKFSWSTGLAIAVGLAGVACILNPFAASPDIRGTALSLSSAVLFALYGVLGTRRVARYGGFVMNSVSFLAGALIMFPYLLATGVPVLEGINSGNILHVLYLSIFVTGLGYMCYLTAMKETSAIETSAVFFIKPALAPLLALAFLGEPLRANMLLGMAFIVAGALLLFRQRLRKAGGAAALGVK